MLNSAAGSHDTVVDESLCRGSVCVDVEVVSVVSPSGNVEYTVIDGAVVLSMGFVVCGDEAITGCYSVRSDGDD